LDGLSNTADPYESPEARRAIAAGELAVHLAADPAHGTSGPGGPLPSVATQSSPGEICPPGHPAWCERQHAADFPAHALEVGGIELGERELDVSLYRYADQLGRVWLCEHDYANTTVLEISAEQAETLGRALIQAASLLAGRLPGYLSHDDHVDLLSGRLARQLAEWHARGAK
jgi:hypothetical protein